MEQFQEILRKRILLLSTYTSGLVLLMVIAQMRQTAGETEEIRAFMSGLNAGLFLVVMIAVAAMMIKYIAALKNEDKRKALYIYENDERRLYIQSKMGGDALQLVLYGLVVATFVSEFFSQTVFFTLLSALLFAAVVKAVFKIVYTKKLT